MNTAVRVEKNLVVIVGENVCDYLDVREAVRIYFDGEKGVLLSKEYNHG